MADASHLNFVPRDLVRTYSQSLTSNESTKADTHSPRERLESALKAEVEHEDALTALIQEAFSSPDRSTELNSRFEELEATVAAFHKAFPEISNENGASRAFSWTSLSQTVSRLQAQHDTSSRRGFQAKSKKGFHGVCEVINNHLGALKLLPQGDKYTTPICGSLELIVKASVNHERIGQEFAAALEEIDDIVRAVRRDLHLYSPPFMISLSVELCCRIINFLALPLQWYLQKSRKRLFSSLNENLSSKYEIEIARIRRLSDEIARGKRHCSEVEVKEICRVLPDIKNWFDKVRLSLQQDLHKRNEEHWAVFQRATEEQHLRLQNDSLQMFAHMSQLFMATPDKIGVPIKQIMDREAQQFAEAAFAAQTSEPEHWEPALSSQGLPSPPKSGDAAVFHRGVEIENGSQCLDPFFDLHHIAPQDDAGNIFLEGAVAQQLQTWTARTASSILGVFGPAALSSDDTARLLLSNYIHAAKRTGIPCVSYFCTVTHKPPTPPRTRETVGLVGLMYALLKQLILHLPLQLPPSPEFSEGRFKALDGTLRTWPLALALSEDLVVVAAPAYLLIAIHGLEMLEQTATIPRLKSFLEVLRRIVGSETRNGPKIKVLFATSGISQVLSEHLNDNEICGVSRGSAGRRPGRSGKGRQRISEVAFLDS